MVGRVEVRERDGGKEREVEGRGGWQRRRLHLRSSFFVFHLWSDLGVNYGVILAISS